MKELSVYTIPLDGEQVRTVEAALPTIFQAARARIEELVRTVRTMPPKNQRSTTCEWFYNSGSGQGGLYAPFENGRAAIWVSSGGDMDENDISNIGFTTAIAWWNTDSGIALVHAGLKDHVRRASTEEIDRRQYFFYSQTALNTLSLSNFGSIALGWHHVAGATVDTHAQMSFDYYAVPMLLPVAEIQQELERIRGYGGLHPRYLESFLR